MSDWLTADSDICVYVYGDTPSPDPTPSALGVPVPFHLRLEHWMSDVRRALPLNAPYPRGAGIINYTVSPSCVSSLVTSLPTLACL